MSIKIQKFFDRISDFIPVFLSISKRCQRPDDQLPKSKRNVLIYQLFIVFKRISCCCLNCLNSGSFFSDHRKLFCKDFKRILLKIRPVLIVQCLIAIQRRTDADLMLRQKLKFFFIEKH